MKGIMCALEKTVFVTQRRALWEKKKKLWQRRHCESRKGSANVVKTNCGTYINGTSILKICFLLHVQEIRLNTSKSRISHCIFQLSSCVTISMTGCTKHRQVSVTVCLLYVAASLKFVLRSPAEQDHAKRLRLAVGPAVAFIFVLGIQSHQSSLTKLGF